MSFTKTTVATPSLFRCLMSEISCCPLNKGKALLEPPSTHPPNKCSSPFPQTGVGFFQVHPSTPNWWRSIIAIICIDILLATPNFPSTFKVRSHKARSLTTPALSSSHHTLTHTHHTTLIHTHNTPLTGVGPLTEWKNINQTFLDVCIK